MKCHRCEGKGGHASRDKFGQPIIAPCECTQGWHVREAIKPSKSKKSGAGNRVEVGLYYNEHETMKGHGRHQANGFQEFANHYNSIGKTYEPTDNKCRADMTSSERNKANFKKGENRK